LARDLAGTRIEHRAQVVSTLAGFAQDGLADDGVHVGFAEIDPHLEAAEELLQVLKLVERLLAGADQQQAPVEIRGEALGDVLHVQHAVRIVLEELLDLVEHDQRERQFLSAEQKCAANGRGQLIDRDFRRLREVGLQPIGEIARIRRE